MSTIERKFNDRAELIDTVQRIQLSSADLDWNRVHVALVDERWVEVDSTASNERLLNENLLIDRAAAANLTGMKNVHPTPEAECNARYAALPSPYTLCLLGMGPDGHTASLFPGAEGLSAALDSSQYCAGIRAVQSEVTGDNLERMTMTPWSILQSRRLILLITGEDKWQVYQQARSTGASADQPISLFIHQGSVPLEVYWAP
jgi:6-phosphogluconolactonase